MAVIPAAVVAVVALVVAWLASPPDLTADDAEAVAVEALESVGIEAAVVEGPERAVHRPSTGDAADALEGVEVWALTLRADGNDVYVEVQRDAGRLVYLDDNIRSGDGGRVLTDAQFDRLGGYRDDKAFDRRTRRNVAASSTVLLVVAVATALAFWNLGPVRPRSGPDDRTATEADVSET